MAQLKSGSTAGGEVIATRDWVTSTIIGGAPAALDTLNELAAAIGDNASYAASITTALAGKLSTTGKAADSDKVDGYHASSLWRSDGATWNPSANILLNQSGNSQEWSFDIKRNGYTGGYWQVWDSELSTMLKVDASNGRVYAPYDFVGNLQGNITGSAASATTAGSATTATTATNLGDFYTADDWFRATGDNNHIKFYGNSRQMTWRTDGTTEAYSGIGAYPFVWTYNGSGSGNRLMLLHTNGRLWTSNYGWLDEAFQAAGSYAASSHNHDGTYLKLSGGTVTGDLEVNGNTFKVGRHIDAKTGWSGGSAELFLGWDSDKLVIGNNAYSKHDLARDMPLNSISVNNPLYSWKNIALGKNASMPTAEWGATGSSTGFIVIEFPVQDYAMIHAEIAVYEYNSYNASTVLVGGHPWNGGWYQYGSKTLGELGKQVRFGRIAATGTYCIVLGESGTTWTYGQVQLIRIQNGNYYDNRVAGNGAYTIYQSADDGIFSMITPDTSGSVDVNTAAYANNSNLLDGINSSQFLRSDVSDTVAAGRQISFYSYDNIESGAGDQASLEVFQDTSGADAFMQFHVSNDFALYFGLDGSTNDLAVGGWSMGANKYKVYHAGNLSLSTLGYTGATNANYITNNNQLANGAGYLTSLPSHDHDGRYYTESESDGRFASRGFVNAAYVAFTVGGDPDTFYPVRISGGGAYGFQMYSVSRGYNWTGPNTWNTASHRGGLTLTMQWSGDTAWGGNDKAVRVIQFDETYSTVAGGIALPVTGGLMVWLRGGGALYHCHSPRGVEVAVTVELDGYEAANGVRYEPRSMAEAQAGQSSITNAWPVRDANVLYDSGNRVATETWVDGAFLRTGGKAADANLLDGINSTSFLRSDADDTMSGTLTITGSNGVSRLRIEGTTPTIDLDDADGDSFYIHVNSNNFYVLADRDGGGDYGTWEGPHPLRLEASTNKTYLWDQLVGSAAFESSSAFAAASHSHGIGNITDAPRWWNNFGDNHTTRTGFNAQGTSLTTGFGWRYVQGPDHGPNVGDTGNGQYYSLVVGLGNDYNYDNYAMQIAIPRVSSNPYLSLRFEEGGSLGAWTKISAAYADSAGAVAWANVSSKPSTFAPSAHTHTPAQAGLGNLSASGNNLAGNFTATGDITAFSDARVKENIETIDNALDKVTQLRGVEYNKIGSEEKSIGVVAQEIREVLPEVVKENEDGMLSVAYGNITGVLIEAIKEQQKQIEELKAQLDGLTK